MDGTFEHGVFALQVLCVIILREGNLYFDLLLRLCPDELLFESGDKRSGTDGQRVVLTLATFERLAVHEAFEVQDDLVFILYRTILYRDGTGVLLRLFLDLRVYFLLGHAGGNLIYFQSLVLAQGNFRFGSYLRSKDKGLALLDLLYVDLRLGYDLQLTLVISLRVCLRDQAVGRVIIEDLRSVHLLDHLARYFSLTETRHIDLVFLSHICVLERFLQLIGGHFDGKLRHVFL